MKFNIDTSTNMMNSKLSAQSTTSMLGKKFGNI